jgi:hypothetical protein
MACSVVDLLTEPTAYERALAAADDVGDPFLKDFQERARCKVAGGRLRQTMRRQWRRFFRRAPSFRRTHRSPEPDPAA